MAVIPLDNLGLSGRTRNVLLRLGIRTLDDLRAVSIEELAQQRNIGLFVISEIKRVLSENESDLASDTDEPLKKEINTKSPAEATYSEEQIDEMKQYSITELKLSQRASKPLLSSHYETMDSLASLETEDLRKLKGLGPKAIEEIIIKRDNWLEDNGFARVNGGQQMLAISDDMEKLIKHLSHAIAPIVPMHWNKLYKIFSDENLLDELEMGMDEDSTSENYKKIFSKPQFVTYLKVFWKKQLPDGLMAVTDCMERIESLNLSIPTQVLIDISLKAQVIFIHWDNYMLNRKNFTDLYQGLGLPDERTNAIILMKLSGANLQETGDHFGVTRERVRQIINRQIRNLPELFEDCFSQPYETFHLSKSEFLRLFPEITSESYEYIAIRYKKGKQVL